MLVPGQSFDRLGNASTSDGDTIRFLPHDLTADLSVGVETDGAALVLSQGAPIAETLRPGMRLGAGQSPPHDLGGSSRILSLALDSDTPDGTGVELAVRGWLGERWTEWRQDGDLDGLDGSTRLQVRIRLLSPHPGVSPSVRSVGVDTQPTQPPVRAQAFGPPTTTIWATREGLVGYTTSNGHLIQPRDHFVALPSTRSLNSLGGTDYMVRLTYHGRTTTVPVWDVGPWNIDDDYWNASRARFIDLPRWTPEDEAAFFNEYNNGRDQFGRYVIIPTSIDLADGTFWDDLGMSDNDWIQVTFLWLDAASPPPRSTPVIVPKSEPSGTATPTVTLTPTRTPPPTPTPTLTPTPYPTFVPGARAPVYRLSARTQADHAYTLSQTERDAAQSVYNYAYEGVPFELYPDAAAGMLPIYRLVNPRGHHLMTWSAAERDSAVSSYGFSYEGIVAFAPQTGTAQAIALHRLIGRTGDYFFTVSIAERDAAVASYGYSYEGVAGYVFP